MVDAYVGIDIGTSGMKAVLIDREGHVHEATATYRPVVIEGGGLEHNPDTWWQALGEIFRKLSQYGGKTHRVKALGLSGMIPAVLLLDSQKKPLRHAILQNDSRSEAYVRSWPFTVDEVVQRVGSRPSVQHVGPRVRWLWDREPDVMARVRHLVGSAEYLAGLLSGVWRLDANWALESGLWDYHTQSWVPEYCEAARINGAWFAPVVPPGSIVGELIHDPTGEASCFRNAPVVLVGADHVAAALGSGLRSVGDCLIKLGSAGDILVCDDAWRPSPQWFMDYHLVPGQYLPNGCMATSGALLPWVLEFVNASHLSWQELDQLAATVPPGSDGLILLPYFAGEKSPIFDGQARGTILGLTLSHRAPHLYRAILEGVAYAFRHHVDVFEEAQVRIRRLVIGDGGATSALWVRIIADVLGKPVAPLRQRAASAVGTALAAAEAVDRLGGVLGEQIIQYRDLVEPDERSATIYEQGYRVFRDLYKATQALFPRLASLSVRDP
ncbi:MAG: FGGY-family carbohydrate kinase [Firmicutes bacterium]|nr:FGGY-family carbohydrate kinase [Bacillota bacterium]